MSEIIFKRITGVTAYYCEFPDGRRGEIAWGHDAGLSGFVHPFDGWKYSINEKDEKRKTIGMTSTEEEAKQKLIDYWESTTGAGE